MHYHSHAIAYWDSFRWSIVPHWHRVSEILRRSFPEGFSGQRRVPDARIEPLLPGTTFATYQIATDRKGVSSLLARSLLRWTGSGNMTDQPNAINTEWTIQ